MKKFFLLILTASLVSAAELCVVTASQNGIGELTIRQLRDIYLHKKQFVDEQKVIAVNLLADNPSRIVFEEKVLQMRREKLNAYWVKQHFKGVSPPLTQASFDAVKLFVQKVPGAIGYIPLSMVDEKVKVLYEF